MNIPFNFKARDYQIPFLSEVEKAINGESDKRFFYQVWHRRSGKDKTNIADVIPRRLIKSPGLVKYVYPTLIMGRDNMWQGMGQDGFRYLNHIPDFIRAGDPNELRMQIPVKNESWGSKLPTASIFQISGADNPDTLRGGNPVMFVFSEWSEHDPYAWDVVEPILRENDGIAVFNMTPKGDNHARNMYEFAKGHPKWYVEMLTAKDTGVFSEKDLEDILNDTIKRYEADGRSETEARAYFEQEYMCSFETPVIGSFYGEGIKRAEKEDRLTRVMYDDSTLVNTAWDLGVDDSTTIWFYQTVGNEVHLIDYYENSGEGLAHYIEHLRTKPYRYGYHYAPHDIQVRELGTGKSRMEAALEMGIYFQTTPKISIEDGINSARALLSRCFFDREKCSRGIDALRNYKKDWDEKAKVFRKSPRHDWASHGADSFRYLAVSLSEKVRSSSPPAQWKKDSWRIGR